MLASMVLTTMVAMRRSVPAKVEPGLKPNQPKARMKVPKTTIGHVMPRHRLRLAVDVLADPRPETYSAGQADNSAHGMHHARAGEIDRPVSQAPVLAGLGKPAAPPHPICIDAVGQRHP